MRVFGVATAIVGALCGMYFAQLIVTTSIVISIITSDPRTGEAELGSEFYFGLVALLAYALAMAGAVTTLARVTFGAGLLAFGTLGAIVTTLAISGLPSEMTGRQLAVVLLPFAGPVLLLVACALVIGSISRRAAQPAVESSSADPSPAQLASAVPMRLLDAPSDTASQTATLEPGTSFDAFEESGEFVRVHGADFDGYLPKWSVRRVA